MNWRTTLRLTSASSSAIRTSRRATLRSSSVTLPRLRSFSKTAFSRSDRLSNTAVSSYQLVTLGAAVADQHVHEVVRVEVGHVVELLAGPHEHDRHADLAGHREHHPALGGAVQLGHHQPVQPGRQRELLRLLDRILTGGGIDDEHRRDVVD